MPDTIQLLNPFLRKARIRVFHFYDGRAPIDGGVITIPADKKHWVQRAYIMGFRNDPVSGRQYKTWAEAYGPPAKSVTVEVPLVEDSAESAGESNEVAFAGGQPLEGDGVRESQSKGRKGSGRKASGLDALVGDESAD
jgi:hypothetical protein